MGTNTALMLNLPRNSSALLLLYIIPSERDVEKAAVINVWNYPVKYYELHHDNFLQLIFTKEIHVRKSTQAKGHYALTLKNMKQLFTRYNS